MKLMQANELSAALKRVQNTVKITRERIQSIAVQAVAYSMIPTLDAKLGREVTSAKVANALYEAISTNKAVRRASLVQYLETYGHLAFDSTAKTFKVFENKRIPATWTSEHETLVMTKMWDEAKPLEAEVSVYDMEDAFRKFIAKMRKTAQELGSKVKHGDSLVAVERAFAKWSAENALREMKADEDVIAEGERQQAIADAKAGEPAPAVNDAMGKSAGLVEPSIEPLRAVA